MRKLLCLLLVLATYLTIDFLAQRAGGNTAEMLSPLR